MPERDSRHVSRLPREVESHDLRLDRLSLELWSGSRQGESSEEERSRQSEMAEERRRSPPEEASQWEKEEMVETRVWMAEMVETMITLHG
ncbi:uncharacterized protein A4U43_C08F34610 [Asparagus officinalis]|nr:uncharacterized protein A4U43_C08F34610 [Asparagus officinalis]